MKPEEILAKVTEGSLSGDALTAEVEKLDVAGQAELRKLSAEAAKKSLAEASALRKERDRANDIKTQAEKDAEEAAKKAEEAKKAANPPSNDTMSQFRVEQKDKAIARLKKDFGLDDATLQSVVSTFEKLDSGKVDADNIFEELKGAYAFVNRDSVLKASAEQRAREAAAAEAEAEAAGAAAGEPAGNKTPKYSDAVKSLAEKAGITPEAAQKVATEGNKRVYG